MTDHSHSPEPPRADDRPSPSRTTGGPYVPAWLKIARVILFASLAMPVLVVLALFGWSFVDDYRGSRELAAALDAAGKAGFPADFRDPLYLDWNSASSDIDSSAFFCQQALSLVSSTRARDAASRLPFVSRKTPVIATPPTPSDPLSEELLDGLRPYVEADGEIFDLLRRASGADRPGKYPIQWDGWNTLLPHLTYARSAARMLVLKSWLDAEEGRSSEAVLDVLDGLAIARPLMEEPLMISHVVATTIRSIAVSLSLERVLARADLSNDDLVALQSALSDCAASLSAVTALEGAVPMLGEDFQRWARVDEYIVYGQANAPRSKFSLAQLRVSRWIERGAAKRRHAHLILLLVDLANEARNPKPQSLSDEYVTSLGDAIRASTPWAQTLDRDTFDSFSNYPKLLQQVEKDRMRLRCAAACIAALRYRKDTGAWPAGLDDLVPAYLDSVPLDSFAGVPLMYKPAGEGIKIYSVGPNGIDDDGRPNLETRPVDVDEKSWGVSDDMGFRVWRRAPSTAPAADEPRKES